MLFGLHYNIGFIQQTLKYAEPSIVRFDKVCRLCVTLRIYLPQAAKFLELILFIETLWPIQPNLDVKNHWSKLALCRNKSIKLSELVDWYLCFVRLRSMFVCLFISSLYWVQYSEGNLSIPLFFHMAQSLIYKHFTLHLIKNNQLIQNTILLEKQIN